MSSENTEIDLRHGDCLDLMRAMPDNSVDSVVTDPPYGLSFMGKAWDRGVPSCEVWKEALRVLKPGGHLLAFAGTRTQHRMACAIEDAGFEIRDMIAWVYGSGFPKSLDVSKAIDKAAGAEREVVGTDFYGPDGKKRTGGRLSATYSSGDYGEYNTPATITAPATPEAQQWDGWGTALKPALEPITVARKPLAKGNTVAANVLEHGTGAINVDGCRVGTEILPAQTAGQAKIGTFERNDMTTLERTGRWPANLIHSGCQEVLDLFPVTKSGGGNRNGAQKGDVFHGVGDTGTPRPFPASSGSAARFFYCAKASKKDRNEGCEGLEDSVLAASNQAQAQLKRGVIHEGNSGVNTAKVCKNNHPTVKPTDLMRYLCRLVTPPSGTVLDPFMGSGSTGKAAVLEGFNFIGCELDAEYIEIAKARIGAVA